MSDWLQIDGEGEIDVEEIMRKIKNLLDPNGIMNPGKMFPDEEELRIEIEG